MFTRRTRGKSPPLSRMMAQLGHRLLCPPRVCEKSRARTNPSSEPLKVRCFGRSSLDCDGRAAPAAGLGAPARSLLAHRYSRVARSRAQDALFDYLHCTRSFSFSDAEYISKNSPIFVRDLLSSVNAEKDVAPAVERFLRYNPINEFEPFFESVGVRPSDLQSLLPRNRMFLSDDHLMLENFQTLCNYGIPRNRIGKIFKEARDIFRCDIGVLPSRLEAYEGLGLSKSTVIKLVICCPTLLVGGIDLQFVEVLDKLKGLGVDINCIGEYLSDKKRYSWCRILDTIEFLEKANNGENQMGELVKRNPAFLFNGSGRKVYVVFGLLLKVGINVDEACVLFAENPFILSEKSLKNISKAVSFLIEIRVEMDLIANIVSNHMKLLAASSLKGPKTVCKELKVIRDCLALMIKEDPLKLFQLASKWRVGTLYQDPTKYIEKKTFLMRLGFVDNSEEMTKALKRFRGRGDQLQERFDCLVEAGLDFNLASKIVKQAPTVLNQTKDVIEKKIDCLVNRLGYPLEILVAFPAYLCYDMERIQKRISMYIWSRDRGAVKPMMSISSILACSDARFVRYFVDVHPEGAVMWESIKQSPHSG
ncbi:transcription termination factor MTEF18, mitochondrial-like [Syzygium oleosum]|uniref:transcription termination factor MTEF18, mitochondrial-like n=1 Tax=Syzygium oleosum TaxID=219896 RepID=UPI0024B8B654|nr:transcription termination factor MTEF18, mitochondrial-like [Syzygium oleosum]